MSMSAFGTGGAADNPHDPASTDSPIGTFGRAEIIALIDTYIRGLDSRVIGDEIYGSANIDAFGADPTGVSDSTAAFASAVTALGGATSGIGCVVFGTGTYKISTNATVLNSAQLGIIGPGSGLCTIMHYGTGDCISATQTGFTQSQNTFPSGAPFRGFTVDGTNAGTGACGFHWGDRSGSLVEDITVQNFTSTGAIGFHFDARNGWANWNRIRVQSDNNTNAFVFDNHCTSGAGWEYNDFDLNCYSFVNQNGVVFQTSGSFTAPEVYRGKFSLTGTFSGGGGANTGICISLVAANSYITDEINIMCESEGTGTMHQSVNFGGASTGIRGWGTFIFEPGSGSNFVASNIGSNTNNFYFDGEINCPGDTYLGVQQYPGGRTTIGNVTISAGFAGSGSIFLNGGNFFVYQLVSGAQAITISNAIAGKGMAFKVVFKQPSSGSAGTVSSWPWKWAGTAPALSSVNSRQDVVDVFTPDGTNFYATLSGLNYA